MPRRNKGKGKRSTRGASRANSNVTVRGSYLLSETVATVSSASILLNPSIFPRANSISSTFENYRYTEIMIEMLPLDAASAGPGGSYWVLGFSSDVNAVISSISSTSQVSECTPSGLQGCSMSLTTNTCANYPSSKVRLSRKVLTGDGSLKWWKVVGDSGTNNWETIQAMLLFYNQFAASVTFNMWIHYTIEFTQPINSSLTRMLSIPSAHLISSEVLNRRTLIKSLDDGACSSRCESSNVSEPIPKKDRSLTGDCLDEPEVSVTLSLEEYRSLISASRK